MRKTFSGSGAARRGARLWRRLSLLAILTAGLAACANDEPILPGERFSVRPETVPLIRSDAEAIRPLGLPPAQVNAAWTQRNGAATGRPAHPAFGASPQIVWTADIGTGGSRRTRLLTRPIVAGNTVFTLDAAGQVSAVARNGALAWSRSLVPEGQRPDSGPGGGLAIEGGVLYVTTGFGGVHALDPASGGTIWTTELGAPIRAAPAVADGRLIVVLRDDTAFALDARSGRMLWRVRGAASGAGLFGGASPAVEGPLAVIPFSSGEVLGVLARNGIQVWGTAVTGGRRALVRSEINDISGDPVIFGDAVYASNQSGRTVALDRVTGVRNWTLPEGAYGPAWPAGSAVFLLSDQGALVRVDAVSGAIVWSTQLPEFADRRRRAAIAHFGPVLGGGRLWVVSGDGLLRAFAPTDGRPLGVISLPAGAAEAPVIAGGVMYVVTNAGQLIALR